MTLIMVNHTDTLIRCWFIANYHAVLHLGMAVSSELLFSFAVVMAAICNRAGHYIFALWFLSSIFYLSFFPRLISAAAGWMSTIL